MESPHPQVCGILRSDKLCDTFLHFPGGLVRKGQGQDFIGRHPFPQQVGNAVGQYTGFPGTGSGDDKRRTLCMQDGFFLVVIQFV